MEKIKFTFCIKISALKEAILDKDKRSLEAQFPVLEYDINRFYSLLESNKVDEASIKRFNNVIKRVRKDLNELGFSIDALLKD